jgi:hypothetical protein
LLFLALSWMMVSCQTVVNIDLPERDSKLVLNAEAHPDSVWRFYLSQSKGILEPGDLADVKTGEITVVGSDGSYEVVDQRFEEPNNSNYSVYRGTGKPQAGVHYQVLVSAPGFEPITATDSIPQPVPVRQVDTSSTLIEDQDFFELNIVFDDPASTQYYDLRLFYYLEVPFDTASGTFVNTVLMGEIPYNFEVESFFGGDASTVINDERFNGQTYTLPVVFSKGIIEGIAEDELFQLFPVYVICELRTVSETYYKYVKSFNDYQSSSFDPFSQPVQVYSNVNQGFGVFSAFSVSRDTIQIN